MKTTQKAFNDLNKAIKSLGKEVNETIPIKGTNKMELTEFDKEQNCTKTV